MATDFSERTGIYAPTEKTKITETKITANEKKEIYTKNTNNLSGVTKTYLNSGSSVPINLWTQHQDRAWRVEERGRYNGDTKSTMLAARKSASDAVQDISPGVSDIALSSTSRSIIDRDWVMSRFMTPDKDLTDKDRANRFFSTTGWKFSSTRLGYNMAINARPQFTRYADIKGNMEQASTGRSLFQPVQVGVPPVAGRDSHGLGMGRYYSEAIDDNATTIFMEFGVPKFNSLLTFFVNAIDPIDSMIANKGYVPKGYYAGKVIGGYFMFCAFPLTTIIIFVAKSLLKFVFGGEYNYYYMTPTMHTYWASVNILVTQLATELGIMSPVFLPSRAADDKMGLPVGIDKEDMLGFAEFFPDIVSKQTGYIDIFGVANRMQRMANLQSRMEYEAYSKKQAELNIDPSNASANDLIGYIERSKHDPENPKSNIREAGAGIFAKLNNYLTISSYIKSVANPNIKYPNADLIDGDSGKVDVPTSGDGKRLYDADTSGNLSISEYPPSPEGSSDNKNTTQTNTGDGSKKTTSAFKDWWVDFTEGFDSVVRDGGSYAIFNVDYQGSISESISNSIGEINTGGLLKQVSQAAKNVNFDLAGGNLIPGFEAVKEQLVGFARGALESATFGLSNIIMGLFGGGYIDIPKKWEDSEISFPTITYTMSLVSPYGNPLSQLQNIYIPLCMILAGSLPLKAGQASYTSPFLCKIFNKGVQDIRLGMITSVSITRGITNLGFSRNKKALAYEVSFTVTDFSTVMSAPINSSIFDELFNVGMDDTSKMGLYLATLASRDIYTNKYAAPKIKRKASRLLMAASQAVSPHSWSMRAGDVFKPLFGIFTEERKLNFTQNNRSDYF